MSDEQNNPTVVLGIYQHYKGDYYKLLTISTQESDGSSWCVYESYPVESKVWYRPFTEFFGTVEVEGQSVPRFQFRYGPEFDCK